MSDVTDIKDADVKVKTINEISKEVGHEIALAKTMQEFFTREIMSGGADTILEIVAKYMDSMNDVSKYIRSQQEILKSYPQGEARALMLQILAIQAEKWSMIMAQLRHLSPDNTKIKSQKAVLDILFNDFIDRGNSLLRILVKLEIRT